MSRWNGTHLRFVCMPYFPPYVVSYTDHETGRIRLYGLIGSLISNITSAMGITYETLPPPDGEYGGADPDPEKFTGMLRSVYQKEADIAVSGFFPNIDIFNHMHYTPCVFTTSTALWTGMKKAFETRPTPYVNAFDSTTWCFIAASMVILTSLCSAEDVLAYGKQLRFSLAVENLLSTLQSLLQEATKNRYSSNTGRFLGGAWMLATYVLMQYFSGDLKANSVVRSPTLRINTLEDLYENRRTHKVLYPKDTPVHDELKAIRGPLKRKVDLVLREGVGLTLHQIYFSNWLEVVCEGKAVLTGENFAARHLISGLCWKTDNFYHLADESFEKRYFSMVMGAHLPKSLRDEINRRISIVFSMGVPFTTSRDLEPRGLNCLVTGQKKFFAIEALTFADVSFSFISHFILLSGCTAALFSEMLFACLSRVAHCDRSSLPMSRS